MSASHTAQFRVLIDSIGEFLSFAGNPDALRATGETWTLDVGARASGVASLATFDAVQADDRWMGVAADAYLRSLPRQNAALVAVKAATDDLQTVLNDLATAILEFWISIATALATLVGGLLVAAAGVAAVITAPAAIIGAGAAIAAAIAALNSAVDAFGSIAADSAAAAVELQQRVADGNAFPRGEWPVSATSFDDASLLDGDGLDWQVRR